MKKHVVALLSLAVGQAAIAAIAAEPVLLQNVFSADEVRFVTVPGKATVTGEATLKLADGSLKSCAGFNVELLPVARYSSERILETYGNHERGQILLEQNPPKFTPDAKDYHEMLLKGVCDQHGKFRFTSVPAGDYYVMAFIIWDAAGGKTGGAVMHRIHVDEGSAMHVRAGATT